MQQDTSMPSALDALRQGEPVIFPTDTLFGLGVSVGHAPSPQVLFDLKGRPGNKPVAWLVSGMADLARLGAEVPAQAKVLARAFWPGPLTIIVKASAAVPAAFASAEGTIGLRCPDDTTALRLIDELGCPIATTSANLSGSLPAQTLAGVDASLRAAVPVCLDDGRVKTGLASTIVDCTGAKPRILRTGAITEAEIAALL